MSIILVALHTSGDIEKRKVPKGFLTFPVEAKLTGHDKKMTALAITDGVASDRFFCFSDDELGRDGTVLRKALLLFLNSTKQESGHLFPSLGLKPLCL